jgi:ferredoxin
VAGSATVCSAARAAEPGSPAVWPTAPAIAVGWHAAALGRLNDMTLLARSPHLVLDGAVLAARALRATHVVVAFAGDGRWLSPEVAYTVAVSRGGLAAVRGTLGAGVVLALTEDTCPLGEVARVARYLAMQSSGQCGPCKSGLPAVASALTDLAAGSGGLTELDSARRTAAGVCGRGACHHPDGTANFVASALDVFAADLAEHLARGTCGRPMLGILPLPDDATEPKLSVDWTTCAGHGLCSRLAPELIRLDPDGHPELLDVPVPFWLQRDAGQAVAMCPTLALTLTKPAGRPPQPVPPPARSRMGATTGGTARPVPREPQPLAASARQQSARSHCRESPAPSPGSVWSAPSLRSVRC